MEVILKVNIVLMSADADYSGKIFDYVRDNYGEIAEIQCTKLDNSVEEIKNNDFQVALIDKKSIEDFIDDNEENLEIYEKFINLINEFGVKIINITEDYDSVNSENIFKFQKLNKFFEKIFETLSFDSRFKFLSERDDDGFEKVNIIVFTSFDEVKCEKAALNYCDKKVKKGEAVVFMSMNPFSYGGGVNELSFTDVLLASKSRHANLKNVIRECLINEDNGLKKFPEFDNIADFNEMNEENIFKLIQALNDMDKFSYLVIDFPVYNLMKYPGIYEKIDKLMIVEGDYRNDKNITRGKEYVEYQNRYAKAINTVWLKADEAVNSL